MRNNYSIPELIKLIAMCTVCLTCLIGVVAMSVNPTNEFNVQLRGKFIDLQLVLVGGVLTEIREVVKVVKKARKPNRRQP